MTTEFKKFLTDTNKKFTELNKNSKPVISNKGLAELKALNINPSEKVHVTLPSGIDELGGFIPSKHMQGLNGKAAAVALAGGDYFAAITFLCEGVRTKAFYMDPATGGRYGALVNTHPGITLKFQTNDEIKRIFQASSISPMTNHIIDNVRSGTISPQMRNATLQIDDYYKMFRQIEGKYAKGAESALLHHMKTNPYAKELLKTKSQAEVLKEIKSGLPPASYSVLQQLSYKYGPGKVKSFSGLVQGSISAALDEKNRDEHLVNGAKHIVYQYMNSKKQWVQDTRVMGLHRLFFTAGERFSKDLNYKLVTGQALSGSELALVKDVASKAGVGNLVGNNGVLNIPDATKESVKSKSSEDLKLNTDLANKGVTSVNFNFKPQAIDGGGERKEKSIVNTEAIKEKPAKQPKLTGRGLNSMMNGDF